MSFRLNLHVCRAQWPAQIQAMQSYTQQLMNKLTMERERRLAAEVRLVVEVGINHSEAGGIILSAGRAGRGHRECHCTAKHEDEDRARLKVGSNSSLAG